MIDQAQLKAFESYYFFYCISHLNLNKLIISNFIPINPLIIQFMVYFSKLNQSVNYVGPYVAEFVNTLVSKSNAINYTSLGVQMYEYVLLTELC